MQDEYRFLNSILLVSKKHWGNYVAVVSTDCCSSSHLNANQLNTTNNEEHMYVVYVSTHDMLNGYYYKYDHGSLGCKLVSSDVILDFLHKTIRIPTKISIIASGIGHWIACGIDQNSLYVFGFNSYGQLGIGSKEHILINPVNISHTFPSNIQFVDIETGPYSTFVLLKEMLNGQLFNCEYKISLWSWGDNSFNKLGLNNSDLMCFYPQRVDIDHVSSISIGFHHAMAIDKKGSVFGWGLNQYGQLDKSLPDIVHKPTKIILKNNLKACHVACGIWTSLISTHDNRLFLLGMIQDFNNINHHAEYNIDNDISTNNMDTSIIWNEISLQSLDNSISFDLTSSPSDSEPDYHLNNLSQFPFSFQLPLDSLFTSTSEMNSAYRSPSPSKLICSSQLNSSSQLPSNILIPHTVIDMIEVTSLFSYPGYTIHSITSNFSLIGIVMKNIQFQNDWKILIEKSGKLWELSNCNFTKSIISKVKSSCQIKSCNNEGTNFSTIIWKCNARGYQNNNHIFNIRMMISDAAIHLIVNCY